ncbi:zinc-ribbon domain-containing protein [uncultured Friedmanniella sp.]|uniref:zinc-ribbon domain-containing protein n=1 Tax=uncultured Friedmanniella sp. TaxID=335381 RepID=UPI0035CB9EDB
MLIFGFSTKQVLLATLVYICEVCGNNAAHRLIKRVRRFTLFFIPIFPVGTRYIDTCTACGRGLKVPGDRAESVAASQGASELR